MSDEKPVLLVVDDNEMNRDMLSRRLRRQDYEVLVAEDGEKALKMVQENTYSLILLDIMMPNLSGYEVLERLKANSSTHHIPVIMISAVDDLDSVVRCIEMGAEDYLFKPFNPVLLKARVGATLRKHQKDNVSSTSVLKHVDNIRAHLAALTDDLDKTAKDTVDAIEGELINIQTLISS